MVSARRFIQVSKPHIYKQHDRMPGHALWAYNPVASPEHGADKRNLAAHNFCRRLMGRT